jgi:hypothetical protein
LDKIVTGKREGRRPSGTSAPKWEDNIEMHSKDTAYGGVDEFIRLRVGTHAGSCVQDDVTSVRGGIY